MSRLNKKNLKRGLFYLKRNGIKSSIIKVAERLDRDRDEEDYDSIRKGTLPDEQVLVVQREETFARPYKISILVPMYETDPGLFRILLDSIGKQTYGNWELCLADASRTDDRRNVVRQFCEDYALRCNDSYGSVFDKVKYVHLEKNLGISGNTNEALNLATGDYIALMDHDDVIEPTTLFDIMWEITRKENFSIDKYRTISKVMMVYTDEDKVSFDGNTYFDHHVKPDFDPILLCTNNYVCHFLVVDIKLARSVGGFRSEYDGAQDHDFVLRCSEAISREQIVHVPKALYHWRSTPESTAENPEAKLYAYEAGRRAVSNHMVRVGIPAVAVDTNHLGFFRISYAGFSQPVLSLSREAADELQEAQLSLFEQEFILIKSDSLKPLDDEYIAHMMECMVHDNVGAVTGRIISAKGKVESAGFDKPVGKKQTPRFAGLNKNYSGYLHRAVLQQLSDDFSRDIVLLRKSAIVAFKPDIVLKEGYDIYYCPEATFKRRIL